MKHHLSQEVQDKFDCTVWLWYYETPHQSFFRWLQLSVIYAPWLATAISQWPCSYNYWSFSLMEKHRHTFTFWYQENSYARPQWHIYPLHEKTKNNSQHGQTGRKRLLVLCNCHILNVVQFLRNLTAVILYPPPINNISQQKFCSYIHLCIEVNNRK